MRKIYDITKRILSVLIAIMVIMSAFSSAFVVVVNADPDDPQSGSTLSIESINVVLEYGASKVGDQYIWTPQNIDAGHAFVYRIDYVFSGTGELKPGEIKIKIPKSILHDRSGDYADTYELSVPRIDEAEADTDYAYYEDGDYLYIVNCIELTAAQDGYFEFSYSTSELTYEYKDNDPDFCDIPECSVTLSREGESDVSQTISAPKVGIDTSAKISSTSKSYDYRRATSWNSNWGEKPADADDYYYLCWTVYTTFSDCTQPFDFKLTDILIETEKDGETVSEIVGYKMSGASGFSDTNTVYDQRPNRILYSDNSSLLYRYDYVLTRHKKSAFPVDTDFSIENKIVATVTPTDLVDPETEEEAVESFINVPAKYKAPIGSYWSEKYGSGRLNYSLDDLRDGVIHYTDTNLYYNVYLYSQAYLWTLEDGASVTDVDKFGKKKVKFEITDDKFTFNGNDRQLTKDDYEIRSVSFDYTFYDAGFNEDELEFYSKSPTYADDETFEIDAKFGDSDEFVRIGRYNLKTGQSEIENAYRDKVRSIASNRIVFEDDALCTGYRITTENVHYYSRINAYPYCRLKGSPYIIEKIGNLNKVYLTNTATTKLFSGDTELFSKTSSAKDIIVGVQRYSYISKTSTSTTNNKVKKYISNNWSVNMYENIETEDGISRVEQETGRFYDLLPMGCEVSESTVRVVNQNGQLPVSAYSVSFTQNYNDTGRTMMVVDIKESGTSYTLYYTTTYSWDNFRDYGNVLDNSVAYETGNENIASGYPDNGGNLTQKDLMKDLDPDTDAKKFIYAQHKKVVSDLLTTATTGLTKKVVAKGVDSTYSLETTLGNDAPYTYKLRLSTNASSRARNIFLYDSLENYKLNGTSGDWQGKLLKVDVSQPKTMGIKPVVYYSPIADLDLAADNYRNYCISGETVDGKYQVSFSQYDSGGTKIWYTKSEMDEFGGIAAAKAICVDLSKDTNGNNYTLESNKSVAVVVNMQSPPTDNTGSEDPCAMNNVYGFNTVVGDFGSEDNNFIYHNYTKVHYRIMGDVGIYKADSTDLSKPLKDICFVLEGKSDYGTNVYSLLPTDSNGTILFRNIEKGTYKLYETEGSIDYQMIKDNMTVVIDGDGIVSIDGASSVTNTSPEPEEGKFTNGYYTIPNKPRVHTDIEFNKRNLAKKKQGVEGVKFRLSGMSSYGNNIILYGVSDETGKVVIYNVEPGTYTLVETETVDGMMLNETDYSVTVDNNGEFTIKNALQDKDGSYVIYNEPYHKFTLQKSDFISADPLSGAKFRLTGVSASGKNVDITKTSGSDGKVTFDRLESGTYTLVETDPPDGYFKDEEKHIVSITKEDAVTITGLEKNDAGNFVVENKKDGTVTIIKKWEDDKDNSERPTPVVHLSVPKKLNSATFLGSPDYDNNRSALTRYVDRNSVNSFKHSDTEPPEGTVTFRMDDKTTDYQILGWFDNGTVYWWSDAQVAYFPKNSRCFFAGLNQITAIDFTGTSTVNVKNMCRMFNECSSLSNLDVSSFDTRNVTDMSDMFYQCKFTTIDLSSFDTSKVKTMKGMFCSCSNMTSIDLSSFDTSNVLDMSNMFLFCGGLTSFDVSSIDTSNVRNMKYMFGFCSGLKSLDFSHNDTSKVINMSQMFDSCTSLTSIDLNNFNTSSVADMNKMFFNCKKLESIDLSSFNTKCLRDMSYMFDSCSSLTSISFGNNFITSCVTKMSYMFNYCSVLSTLDLSSFDTSIVNNMSHMFNGCSGLSSINISSFDTSSVTDMSFMFSGCKSLTNLSLGNFDTSSVTTMSYMFNGCSGLSSINISSFDTSSVTDMSYMFYLCKSLTDLSIGNFDTLRVKNMSNMFYQCSGLSTLDLSNFDTSSVNDMSYMFAQCSFLADIDVSSFDTSSVGKFSSMFKQCKALTILDLSNFDINNARYIDYMFAYCSGLTSLDIRSFAPADNISNSAQFIYDFQRSATVYISDLWTMSTSSWSVNNVVNVSATEYHDPDAAYINGNLMTFISGKKSTVLSFEQFAGSDSEAQSIISGGTATRIDDQRTNKVAYAWYDTDNDTIYWWSDAVSVYLPESCKKLFQNCSKLISISFSGLDSSRVKDMSYLFYYCSSLTNPDLGNLDTSSVTNMRYMFYACTAFSTIDIRGLDLSNVERMDYMFANCNASTDIYLSGLNLSNVKRMDYMFANCHALTGLDLSGLDLSNVERMNCMFNSCKALTSLDMRSHNISNVRDMTSMFGGCIALTSIDFSGQDLSNVKYMDNMFSGCNALTTVDFSGSDLSSVKSMYRIFYDLDALKTVDFSNVDTSNLISMYYMFASCNNITSLNLTGFDTPKVKTMEWAFFGCRVLQTLDVSTFDTSNVTNMYSVFYACENLQTLDVSGFDTSHVTTMNGLFGQCRKLSVLDVSGFDTSKVTNMSEMFYRCLEVKTLDVTNFDTSSVTTMEYMFQQCGATEIDVSGFDTSKVTNMAQMFYLLNVDSLDLSSFDTTNVTKMHQMFLGSSGIKNMNLSSFDTTNVTNMSEMFKSCSGLTTLDLSSFDISNVNSIYNMFEGCSGLTSLDLSGFENYNNISLNSMFKNCYNLTSLDVTGFDTSGMTSMSNLFYNCSKLTELDLSNFNISTTTDMSFMLYNCTALKTIYVSKLWKTENVSSSYKMFDQCFAIVGEKGTTYNTSYTDKTYARVDDPGNNAPGYLTLKTDDKYVHYISDTTQPQGLRMEDGSDVGNARCILDKDAGNNTWKYTFTGIDDTVSYIVWEEDLDGYTGNATEAAPGEVVEGSFTITNVSPSAPKYGGLKINKLLSAAPGEAILADDMALSFVFDITLKDENGEPVSGVYTFGDIPFTDGKATITILPDDENDNGLTLTGIPENWSYTITEQRTDGYELTVHQNDSGSITADATAEAVFTNEKQPPPVIPKADVALKKLVTGNHETIDDSFTFTVALSGLEANQTYLYEKPDSTTAEFTADRTGSKDLTLRLSSDQTIILKDLPDKATYRITEAAGDYVSSYSVVDARNLELIKQSSGANSQPGKALSTDTETVNASDDPDKTEEVTVTFTNRIDKTQDLKLRKVISPSSGANTDPFDFIVTLRGLQPEMNIRMNDEYIQADSSGIIEVRFVMTDNKEVIFHDLPVKSTYKITEQASSYVASYLITDSKNLGKIVRASDSNGTESEKELSTSTETVDQGEDVTVTFTNRKLDHDLSISKIVDMSYGDVTQVDYKTRKFNFEVSLKNLTVNKTYTISRTSTDMTGSVDETFRPEASDHTLQIELTDGETVTLRNLEEGVLYTVTELYDDTAPNAVNYLPSYIIHSNDEAVIAKTNDSKPRPGELSTSQETVDQTDLDVNIVFTNTYFFDPYVLPESGFEDHRMILIAAFAGMVIFAALFIISRKTLKRER